MKKFDPHCCPLIFPTIAAAALFAIPTRKSSLNFFFSFLPSAAERKK